MNAIATGFALLILLFSCAVSFGQTKFFLPHVPLADYDAELRGPDKRVDTDAMVRRLKELHVTTYYWLVWHAATDWDDLKRFLPEAAKAHINVWVYLVPPTEGPAGGYPASEPFKLDYLRWAQEIAQLSLDNKNLTAWVMDDFYANHALFTPDYVRQMQAAAGDINPKLAFLPLMYFPEITSRFAQAYHGTIDGVVVAYPQDREEIISARAILNDEALIGPRTFGCPAQAATQAGDFVSAGISARVTSTNHVILRFSEMDDFNGPTYGYHFKQLLVDDAVVWEEDIAGGTNGWHAVAVDATAQTRGRKNVKVAFRLFDRQGVSNFGAHWRVKDLNAQGLKLATSLNKPVRWQVEQHGPLEAGFGDNIRKGRRRFHIPMIVMTAASPDEFRLRHGDPASPDRMAGWLKMCLETWKESYADGVVTYCLDLSTNSALFPSAANLFHDFGHK